MLLSIGKGFLDELDAEADRFEQSSNEHKRFLLI